MSTAGWKKFSIGRADLLLPPDAKISNVHTLVNDIDVSRVHLNAGETFEEAWVARSKLIEAGKGADNGTTRILKTYPASLNDFSVLYEESPDPQIDKTLESWHRYGSLVYRGKTVVSLTDLRLGEQFTHEVFSNLNPEALARSKDDFAVEDAVIHIPSNGGESTSADVSLEAKDSKGQPITLSLSLSNSVLTTAGNVTVIRRMQRNDLEAKTLKIETQTLRRGPRTLSGLSGEESVDLLSEPGKRGSRETSFRSEWESAGLPNNGSAPETILSARIDEASKFDPASLLTFWDAVSSSLHYR